MKTNLVFKRTTDERVEMLVVPVDIPFDKGTGWTLVSCCDNITFMEDSHNFISDISQKSNTQIVDSLANVEEIPAGGKYQSSVSGTARLVRYKDTIRIVYRKGKTTCNRNEPNSVCIDDITKQQFFNAVKRKYCGADVPVWQLVLGDREYNYYNTLVDRLYEQGRIAYNKTKSVIQQNIKIK